MLDSHLARDTHSAAAWIGRVLDGRYRIEERLAEGGFGVVFRATQLTIERPVAVKLLHGAYAADDRHGARFRREALALAQLRHPAIVQVIDFGTLDDGACYLVMELLEGETLQAHLARSGPLAPDRVIDIGVALLGALAEAHARGVVHRDLKPANVIVTRRGERTEVKLVDFGIAKLAQGAEHDSGITQTGVLIGSPRYLSPEQAADLPVTDRTDIYALGLVLYELLIGRPAFTRQSACAYIVAHLDEPPDAPVRGGVAVRGRILQTLMRLMAKTPGERPSARAAAALLEACRGEPLIEASTTEPEKKRGVNAAIVVGRGAEQDAFEQLLDGDLRVLTFVGPGGVGKTTLLGLLCERARDRGLRVKWLDGVELASLGQLMSVTFRPVIDDPPDLIVIDRAERVGPALDALRDGILPELPLRTRLLMATRKAPGWDLHPASIGTTRELTLGNLSVPEACTLLEQRGVPEHLRLAAWDETRGHPLTLSLMSDLLKAPGFSLETLVRGGDSPRLLRTGESPALLERLARELVEHVPSEAHLRGLLAASLVRRLSEDDLAQVILPEQVPTVRRWLADLACAKTRAGGIELHDLTRRVFLLEAKLHTPDKLSQIFDLLAERALERLRRSPDALLQERLVDIGYIIGQLGDVPYDPIDVTDLEPMVVAQEHHWPAIEALLERFEGAGAVRTLRAWRASPHCHTVVVEGGGALIGFAAGLRLDTAPAELLATDPGVERMARLLFDERKISRARPSLYFRFWAGQHHHMPSHTQTHIFYYLMRLATSVKELGAMVSAHHPPEFWRRLHPHSAHEMFEAAAFEVDGRAFMPFGRDFSHLSRREWLVEHFRKMLEARHTMMPPPPSYPLSQELAPWQA
ncbi:MAG: serine/threonine-protein kinase PknK [Deltaproteobacteria bacterium]|nr:serine/threonine-protein kinase PknK [Deltaproteobacteria bacterium]